jgi:hypothetical protein
VVHYRRALPEDFAGIVELQNRNLSWNLAERERSDGFLSTAFSIEHFKKMNEEVGIVVGVDDGKLCGYVCASTPEFNKCMPFPAAMLSYASKIAYKGQSLIKQRFCVTSPICIDRNHRGNGVYLELCNKMIELISGKYDLAVSFISTGNSRHLQAMKKMAWDKLGEFEKDGETFLLIVLALPGASRAP